MVATKNIFLFLLHGLLLMSFSSMSSGAEQYLIQMPGPKAALAKSFKAGDEGTYHFTLDTTKMIKDGSGEAPVSFKVVKAAVEKRLKRFKAKVTAGSDKDSLTIKWDVKKANQDKFLEKLAKVKIKGGSGSSVKVASAVSDGGVRARTTARDPANKEVQARVLKVKDGTLEFQVVKKGPGAVSIPLKKKLKSKPKGFTAKTGQMFYFIPTKEVKGVWEGSGFSIK